ncbi:lambda-exonuclease family protein [Desulfovibrio sp.]|uniref:lambda-exonuclease family protein n=1 Tax=Desulfovibrio sp. TaxID=885 RepID=UPI0025C270C6|nr:YqaJ viral recombinase family protein [Desulfovibrio sp.]
MRIIDVAQGSQEWLAWRREGITGTDMPALMKQSAYLTPLMVWREKVGLMLPEDLSRDPNVLRGKRCEPANRRLAESLLGGEFLLPYCIEDEEDPLFRFSSDGITDGGIMVEIKAPGEKVFREIQEQGVKHPAVQSGGVQLQYGMSVGKLSKGMLLMCLNDEEGNVLAHLVLWREAKPNVWENMRRIGREFHQLVLSQTPPELDPEKDVVYPTNYEQQLEWGEKAQAYIAAEAKLNRLVKLVDARKQRLKDAQANLEALMGNYSKLACPVEDREVALTRWGKRGSIDYKQLIEDHHGPIDPSLADMYRKQSGYVDYKAMADDLFGAIDQTVLQSYRKAVTSQIKTTVRNSRYQLPLPSAAAA